MLRSGGSDLGAGLAGGRFLCRLLYSGAARGAARSHGRSPRRVRLPSARSPWHTHTIAILNKDRSGNLGLSGFGTCPVTLRARHGCTCGLREKRQREGAPKSTINRELALLRRAFARIDAEPHKASRVPKFHRFTRFGKGQRATGICRRTEYRRLASLAKEPWLRALLALAYTYGFRKAELLEMKCLQVDLSQQYGIALQRRDEEWRGAHRVLWLFAVNLPSTFPIPLLLIHKGFIYSMRENANNLGIQNFTRSATSTSSFGVLRITLCRDVSCGVPALRVTTTLTCVSPPSRFGLGGSNGRSPCTRPAAPWRSVALRPVALRLVLRQFAAALALACAGRSTSCRPARSPTGRRRSRRCSTRSSRADRSAGCGAAMSFEPFAEVVGQLLADAPCGGSRPASCGTYSSRHHHLERIVVKAVVPGPGQHDLVLDRRQAVHGRFLQAAGQVAVAVRLERPLAAAPAGTAAPPGPAASCRAGDSRPAAARRSRRDAPR